MQTYCRISGGNIMALATISARIDAQDKKDFDLFCEHVGISTSAAVNMYVKAVLKMRKIPFEISDDDLFYSENNIHYLENILEDINTGNAHFSEHDLIEEDL